MREIQRKGWSESDQEAIRHQLDRILNSGPFHQSQRRQRFLEYLVNEALAGRSDRLKGYNVALEVFDRPETFDPILDPVVRIEARRLREKLREYYDTDGQDDPVRIYLPKGSYTPHIEFRTEGAPRHARQEPLAQEASSTVPSVAVLPFDDLSADQNLGYLGDGVAEDIITALCDSRTWWWSPAVPPSPTTTRLSMSGRSATTWASDTWSKAAYARTATRFESYLS